jgi:hypothetical protein
MVAIKTASRVVFRFQMRFAFLGLVPAVPCFGLALNGKTDEISTYFQSVV